RSDQHGKGCPRSALKTCCRGKRDCAGGGMLLEVCEQLSTQTCSEDCCRPASRTRDIAGLRIREWTFYECGAVDDRATLRAPFSVRDSARLLKEPVPETRSPGAAAFRWGSGHGSSP